MLTMEFMSGYWMREKHTHIPKIMTAMSTERETGFMRLLALFNKSHRERPKATFERYGLR